MLPIVVHSAELIPIVVARDGENGDVDTLILRRRQRQLIPIGVRDGVLDPGLKMGRGIADNAIKLLEWQMVQV